MEERGREKTKENSEHKLQHACRAIKRVLDPAVPDLRSVEVGDAATCSGCAVKRWSTRALGEKAG